MREAAVHRAIGGDQGLADYLPAEHALPADLRAQTSEQVLLEPLDIEDCEELVERAAHGQAFRRMGSRRLAVSLRVRNVALLGDAWSHFRAPLFRCRDCRPDSPDRRLRWFWPSKRREASASRSWTPKLQPLNPAELRMRAASRSPRQPGASSECSGCGMRLRLP